VALRIRWPMTRVLLHEGPLVGVEPPLVCSGSRLGSRELADVVEFGSPQSLVQSLGIEGELSGDSAVMVATPLTWSRNPGVRSVSS